MTHTSVFSASQKLPVFFTSKTIQKRTKSSMRLRWSIVALVLTMKCNNTNAFVLRSILPYFNFLTFLTLVYAYVLFRAISSMNHFKKKYFRHKILSNQKHFFWFFIWKSMLEMSFDFGIHSNIWKKYDDSSNDPMILSLLNFKTAHDAVGNHTYYRSKLMFQQECDKQTNIWLNVHI